MKYYDEFVMLLEMEEYKKYDLDTIHLPRQPAKCGNGIGFCGVNRE